ncbi:MAG: Gx transporter family protein [Oscillospiraceae bacterium]|nr:Gx transporter family protein [Oscillospiraceae bacterium]
MKTKRIALYGLLIALALILSYLEARIPAFFAVPGMKLGITNLVVLAALYLMDAKSAVFINILRIILVSVLFGTGVSLAYSLAGGLLSGLVMILLKKTGRFGIVAVSTAGGVAHNIGQILTAMALLGTRSLAWYLLILWFTGIASGAVIGLLGGLLCGRLEGIFKSGGGKE